jgi:hypothetical protein
VDRSCSFDSCTVAQWQSRSRAACRPSPDSLTSTQLALNGGGCNAAHPTKTQKGGPQHETHAWCEMHNAEQMLMSKAVYMTAGQHIAAHTAGSAVPQY